MSTGIIDFSFRGTASDKNGVTRPTPAEIAAGAVGVGTLSRFGTFGKASSKNEGLFAQDSWQIGKRLTLNLGIRIERENVPSFTAGRPGIKFGFGSKIAPRIGQRMMFEAMVNGKFLEVTDDSSIASSMSCHAAHLAERSLPSTISS